MRSRYHPQMHARRSPGIEHWRHLDYSGWYRRQAGLAMPSRMPHDLPILVESVADVWKDITRVVNATVATEGRTQAVVTRDSWRTSS